MCPSVHSATQIEQVQWEARTHPSAQDGLTSRTKPPLRFKSSHRVVSPKTQHSPVRGPFSLITCRKLYFVTLNL